MQYIYATSAYHEARILVDFHLAIRANFERGGLDYFDEIHENLAKEDNNNNKKNTGTRDDDSSSKKFARYWMPDTCRKDRQMLRLKE